MIPSTHTSLKKPKKKNLKTKSMKVQPFGLSGYDEARPQLNQAEYLGKDVDDEDSFDDQDISENKNQSEVRSIVIPDEYQVQSSRNKDG
jgi:hypothetical protein